MSATGDFTQYKTQERRFQDTTPAQNPVADNSKAMSMQGLAQGVGDLADTALSIFGGIREAEANSELARSTKAFEDQLIQASEMSAQKGDSAQLQAFLQKSYKSSPLPLDVKNKLLKGFESTVLGKSFSEKSPEELAEEHVVKEAGKQAYYPPGSSQEVVDQGTLDFLTATARKRSNDVEMERLTLEAKRKSATAAERSAASAQATVQRRTNLATEVWDERDPTKNKVVSLLGQYANGDLDRKTAENALKSLRGDRVAYYTSKYAQMNVNERDALVKPELQVLDLAINNISSATLLADVGNELDRYKATTELAVRTQNPEHHELIVSSSMINHASSELTRRIREGTLSIFRKNEESNKPHDPTTQDEGTTVYLEVVKEGLGNIGKTTSTGLPLQDPQEALTQVNNVLRGGGRYLKGEDPVSENAGLVKWFADPVVGTYIRENQNLLSANAISTINSELKKNLSSRVYPTLQGSLSFATGKRVGTRKTEKVGVLEEEVEMVVSGESVVFTGVDEHSSRQAQSMTEAASPTLSTYFRAMANLTGKSFEQVFEEEKSSLWPSKYGEEQTQEGQSGDVADDPNKGKTFRHKVTGKLYTVGADGVPVEVGGSGND